MSSNNVNNFQGNAATSSNNVDVFAEIINGGGGAMIEFDLYAANMWEAGTPTQSAEGFHYVSDGGGNWLGVMSAGSESAMLEPVGVVIWKFQMASTPPSGPNANLEDYYNAYVGNGNSLPASMAIPFANMFFKAMADVVGAVP